MSPIEIRQGVRAQPIVLERGIEFRDRRTVLAEDLRGALARIAVSVDAGSRWVRSTGTASFINFRKDTTERIEQTRHLADRIAALAAPTLVSLRERARHTQSRLDPWIADGLTLLQQREARLGLRKRARTIRHWTEARFGHVEFEGYIGAAIVVVALAILIHGLTT
jgi:hypothetical protein